MSDILHTLVLKGQIIFDVGLLNYNQIDNLKVLKTIKIN